MQLNRVDSDISRFLFLHSALEVDMMSEKKKQKLIPYQHLNKNDETEKHKKNCSQQDHQANICKIKRKLFTRSNLRSILFIQ